MLPVSQVLSGQDFANSHLFREKSECRFQPKHPRQSERGHAQTKHLEEAPISKSYSADVTVSTVHVANSRRACHTRVMSKGTTEMISGAVRDIEPELRELFTKIVERDPHEAVKMLEPYPDEFVVKMLELLNPAAALKILQRFNLSRRETILATASSETTQQWMRNQTYPERTVGRLMQPPLAVFRPTTTVAEATEQIRRLARKAIITYAFVTDEEDKLLGVVVMRDMLLAQREQRLEEIMLKDPFYLTPDMSLTDAMRAVLVRHYPVYPVCEKSAQLIGLVRGQMLFEAQAVELSAQPGEMVGVETEERLTTPWSRSLRFRHPWLQVNLFCGLLAAVVVGLFEHTIDRIIALAVFLPVLIGQAANTGVQALAVCLRGITLGDLRAGKERLLLVKEALLGTFNGALTGVTGGVAMFIFATMVKSPQALMLSFVVFLAITISCCFSGVAGAVVPLVMKKLGADPAMASSIVVTTFTDVGCLLVFLGLAAVMI
jgi:magnesium transporter